MSNRRSELGESVSTGWTVTHAHPRTHGMGKGDGMEKLDTELSDAIGEIDATLTERLQALVDKAGPKIEELEAERVSLEDKIARMRDRKRVIKVQMDMYLDSIARAKQLMRGSKAGGAPGDVVI